MLLNYLNPSCIIPDCQKRKPCFEYGGFWSSLLSPHLCYVNFDGGTKYIAVNIYPRSTSAPRASNPVCNQISN